MKFVLSKTDERLTLAGDRILCNDVVTEEQGSENPHGVGLWLIHNANGLIAAVWASGIENALDEAADADLLQSCALSEAVAEEYGMKATGLGNAGELFDLSNVGLYQVPWSDIPSETKRAFFRAVDDGADTLADV